MAGLTITCCTICNKWFDYDDVEVAVYDHGMIMNFCTKCGNRLLKNIKKMKGESEDSGNE